MSDRIPDYAQGFKDGFAAGLEEGKKLNTPQIGWPSYLGSPGTCQVCGRLSQGIMGYVCYDPKCPTRVTAYATGGAVIGAVGSMDTMNSGVGANGPEGTISYADWAGNPTNALSDK